MMKLCIFYFYFYFGRPGGLIGWLVRGVLDERHVNVRFCPPRWKKGRLLVFVWGC